MPRLIAIATRCSLLLASFGLLVLLLSACNPTDNLPRTNTPDGSPTRGPYPTIVSVPYRKAGAVITGDNGAKIELLGTLIAHMQTVFRLDFSPDGRYMISIDASGTAVFWDLDTGSPKFNIGAQETIYAFFNADASQIISVDTAEKVFFIDTSDGQTISSVPANSGGVRSAAISSDRTLLAAGGFKGDLSIWNIQTRALLHRIAIGRDATMIAVAFSPDDKTVAVTTNDKSLYLFDVGSGQQLQAVTNLTDNAGQLIFAPDGTFLVVAVGDNPSIYNLAPFGLRKALIASNQLTDIGLSLSPDSKLLAVSTRGDNINIWSIDSGSILTSLLEQKQAATSLAFAPNGSFLLDTIFAAKSGSFIWLTSSFSDSDPNVSGKNFNMESVGVNLGVWTPDSKRIVLADGSGGLFVYGLPE